MDIDMAKDSTFGFVLSRALKACASVSVLEVEGMQQVHAHHIVKYGYNDIRIQPNLIGFYANYRITEDAEKVLQEYIVDYTYRQENQVVDYLANVRATMAGSIKFCKPLH
ncbi:hypothetical protein FRX31_023333 [Thalictrum thalictroides]|uniref:Uncharacterized protein n=1 Tax=Thalictrum thalictroides TaxID=46969 RepID=A0A7J6VSB5_THATH|nr:hypothetical protein FRX31_023333 [Thalictrum thalictroides]